MAQADDNAIAEAPIKPYASTLLPTIHHCTFPHRSMHLHLLARYNFFGGSSSSSGIFGNLCAIPLWQSMQVKPALNPSAMVFAAVSVCLCGSMAAAEWQFRHSCESFVFIVSQTC